MLTNVNANADILRLDYLQKVKALAEVFRPYGIKVYLTARFSAPIELGKLQTCRSARSRGSGPWWTGQDRRDLPRHPRFRRPAGHGPPRGASPARRTTGRTHADGANMLADALAPHHGILMWRAFVYAAENAEDRHKQAYAEFQPLDGKFRDNVLVQVKNGAIDFQPREPLPSAVRGDAAERR